MLVERPTPVFQQVVLILEKRIHEGIYSSGHRLPAESQLAKEFGVSRGTIQNALTKLESAGLIQRRHGSGTYVTTAVPKPAALLGTLWEFGHLIEMTGKPPRVEALSVEIQIVSDDDRESLDLDHGTQIVSTVRRHFAGDNPVILSFDRFPLSIFNTPVGQIDFSRHIQVILREDCNEEIAYSNARILAVNAGLEKAEWLALKPGDPLLMLKDVIFNRAEDRPIVRSDAYLNAHELTLYQLRPWY